MGKKKCHGKKEKKKGGGCHLLIKDLALYNHEVSFLQFRMNPTKCDKLLSYVASLMMKASENREPIGPSEKLCVILRYLVTGDAQSTISLNYRIAKLQLVE